MITVACRTCVEVTILNFDERKIFYIPTVIMHEKMMLTDNSARRIYLSGESVCTVPSRTRGRVQLLRGEMLRGGYIYYTDREIKWG